MVNGGRILDDRYELRQKLGEGGMGVVYLAFDLLTQSDVAVKMMTGHQHDPEKDQKAYSNFKNEIQIAKELKDAHVLAALDSGEAMLNGRRTPYLVSEYMSEGSLEDLIRRGNVLPWRDWTLLEIADAILQAAQGLWYLHTHNPMIVHRDVKPSNYLIRSIHEPGRKLHLYLCDFGLARKQRSEADYTTDPHATVQYVAPEQIGGGISYLSDQYSLAIMACYLLTGHFPINASGTIEMVLAHRDKQPLAPSVLNYDRIRSAEIDSVILKALEKDPLRRHSSVIVFARALEQVIRAQAASSAPTSVRGMSETAAMPESSLPMDRLDPLFFPVAFDLVRPVEDDEIDIPLPGDVDSVVISTANSDSSTLPVAKLRSLCKVDLPARPSSISWSRDGDYVACFFYKHSPVLVDRHNKRWDLPVVAQGHVACWTPDQFVMVISSKGKASNDAYIRVCNIARSSEWPPTFPLFRTSSIDALDVSCQRLLALWIESEVLVYPLPAWSSTMQLPHERYKLVMNTYADGAGVLRWSPDGSLLAAGARDGSFLCWQVRREMTWYSEPAIHQRITGLAWSADSAYLAIAYSDKRVVVWNMREKRKATIWTKLSASPKSLSISLAGRLAIASSKQQLLLGDLDQSGPTAIHPGYWLADWSPTRSELATIDPEDQQSLVIWQE